MLPLVAGYFQFHLPQVAIGCLVIGLFWLLSLSRRWAWPASMGLVVFMVLAGMGAWIRMSPILIAFSVLGSLFAWDLDGYSRHLRNAAPEDPLKLFEKAHLQRLAILAGTGLILIVVAVSFHVQISFGWMFLLALVAVLGLIQLVDRLRRGE
jgi:hypothetical protein